MTLIYDLTISLDSSLFTWYSNILLYPFTWPVFPSIPKSLSHQLLDCHAIEEIHLPNPIKWIA